MPAPSDEAGQSTARTRWLAGRLRPYVPPRGDRPTSCRAARHDDAPVVVVGGSVIESFDLVSPQGFPRDAQRRLGGCRPAGDGLAIDDDGRGVHEPRLLVGRERRLSCVDPEPGSAPVLCHEAEEVGQSELVRLRCARVALALDDDVAVGLAGDPPYKVDPGVRQGLAVLVPFRPVDPAAPAVPCDVMAGQLCEIHVRQDLQHQLLETGALFRGIAARLRDFPDQIQDGPTVFAVVPSGSCRWRVTPDHVVLTLDPWQQCGPSSTR